MSGCARCHGEGWVCENHTSKGWPSVCECGAGSPCPSCNPLSPPFARLLAFVESLVRENDTEEWLEEEGGFRYYGDKPDEAFYGGQHDARSEISRGARAAIAKATETE